MLRKLTEKEIQTFENIGSRKEALDYIKSLEGLEKMWEEKPLNPYLRQVQSFILCSRNFKYSYSREGFARRLWVADFSEELPKLQRCLLSTAEALKFVNSIIFREDEYYWPEDLIANDKSIANVDMSTFSDTVAAEWEDGEIGDKNDFISYVIEYFIYYIETIPGMEHLKKTIKKETIPTTTQTKKRNGEKIMNIFGEGFGTIEGMAISMMTGEMAIPGDDGKFFTFNSKSKEITDVTDMVIKMELPAYAMPVAPETIVAGDIVRHNGQFLFISSVTKAGKITGTKPDTAEEATIVPIKNALFNQSFVAKVTTMNMFAGTPGAEGEAAKGPFGEMNPMLLMLMLKDKDGSSSNSMDKLLPLMMMQQGGLATGAADGQMNPMMMMLLMEKMGK